MKLLKNTKFAYRNYLSGWYNSVEHSTGQERFCVRGMSIMHDLESFNISDADLYPLVEVIKQVIRETT